MSTSCFSPHHKARPRKESKTLKVVYYSTPKLSVQPYLRQRLRSKQAARGWQWGSLLVCGSRPRKKALEHRTSQPYGTSSDHILRRNTSVRTSTGPSNKTEWPNSTYSPSAEYMPTASVFCVMPIWGERKESKMQAGRKRRRTDTQIDRHTVKQTQTHRHFFVKVLVMYVRQLYPRHLQGLDVVKALLEMRLDLQIG